MIQKILTTDTDRQLAPERISTLLWISVSVLVGSFAILLLLNRLGLPLYFTYLTALGIAAVTMVALAWMGRTMTLTQFFFADRQPFAAVIGIGGGTDWVSGAWLLLFAAASTEQRLLWVPALMLGLLMMSALFAGAYHRSETATLAGFFEWRYPGSGAGPLAIAIVSVVLFMLALAEFEAASRVIATIGVTPPASVGWIVLFLAVLPIITGGWLALLLVNLVLVVWMLLAILAPSVLLGLLPQLLALDSAGLVEGSILQPLGPLPVLSLSVSGLGNGIIALFGLAVGFSVLPHVFSRLALGQRASAAMEHLGWSALFAFIVIIVSALSITVVTQSQSDDTAKLMANIPMIHVLPYIAVLIAALNALSATIMAFSAGIVRGLLRTRRFKNSERAMFLTRLTAIILAVFIGWYFETRDIPIGSLFVLALSLAGAAFFTPLVSAAWVAQVPKPLVTGMMGVGAGVVGLEIWNGLLDGPVTFFANPLQASLAVMVLSALALSLYLFFGRYINVVIEDTRLTTLRGE